MHYVSFGKFWFCNYWKPIKAALWVPRKILQQYQDCGYKVPVFTAVFIRIDKPGFEASDRDGVQVQRNR